MELPEAILSLPAEAASLVLLKLVPAEPLDPEELAALGAAVQVFEASSREREGAMARAIAAWFNIRIRQVADFVEASTDG